MELAPDGLGTADRRSTLTQRSRDQTETIALGDGQRALGTSSRGSSQQVAAAGAWTSATTYAAQLRWYETPNCLTVEVTVDGRRANGTARLKVSFGPTDLGELTGAVT